MKPQLNNNKLVLSIEDLFTIDPLTETQMQFFKGWKNSVVNVLHGVAGTGKTFISMYRALEDVLDKGNAYKKLIILRSAVAARDIGALPGDVDEKAAIYELPYVEICHSLFNRWDAYDRLKEQHRISFALTSYVRGITFDNSIVLVDEMQNMNYQELYSVMTRIGENSKIVFCGDFRQTDLKDSGLQKFLSVLKLMNNVNYYEFNIDDIVRSEIVKNFIIASTKI